MYRYPYNNYALHISSSLVPSFFFACGKRVWRNTYSILVLCANMMPNQIAAAGRGLRHRVSLKKPARIMIFIVNASPHVTCTGTKIQYSFHQTLFRRTEERLGTRLYIAIPFSLSYFSTDSRSLSTKMYTYTL